LAPVFTHYITTSSSSQQYKWSYVVVGNVVGKLAPQISRKLAVNLWPGVWPDFYHHIMQPNLTAAAGNRYSYQCGKKCREKRY